MKNSFVSEVDMTFATIREKYIDDAYLELVASDRGIKQSFGTFKVTSSKKKETKREDNIVKVDNMILSHLSSKRKTFSIDRFEKIFERFDKYFIEIKRQYYE